MEKIAVWPCETDQDFYIVKSKYRGAMIWNNPTELHYRLLDFKSVCQEIVAIYFNCRKTFFLPPINTSSDLLMILCQLPMRIIIEPRYLNSSVNYIHSQHAKHLNQITHLIMNDHSYSSTQPHQQKKESLMTVGKLFKNTVCIFLH